MSEELGMTFIALKAVKKDILFCFYNGWIFIKQMHTTEQNFLLW